MLRFRDSQQKTKRTLPPLSQQLDFNRIRFMPKTCFTHTAQTKRTQSLFKYVKDCFNFFIGIYRIKFLVTNCFGRFFFFQFWGIDERKNLCCFKIPKHVFRKSFICILHDFKSLFSYKVKITSYLTQPIKTINSFL